MQNEARSNEWGPGSVARKCASLIAEAKRCGHNLNDLGAILISGGYALKYANRIPVGVPRDDVLQATRKLSEPLPLGRSDNQL